MQRNYKDQANPEPVWREKIIPTRCLRNKGVFHRERYGLNFSTDYIKRSENILTGNFIRDNKQLWA